jgi:hypothetical protein
MRIIAVISWIFAALIATAAPAHADVRVALVIGNSAYQSVPSLPNPINDAADLSASLVRLGFSVNILKNAKYDDMRRALIEFGQRARGADFALIFFAGHGIQMAGENWIIPVDAQLATDLDVANEAIALQALSRTVSNTSKLGMVILDACRSNPFVPKMLATNVQRAVERGFSRVEPSDNVLVAYSAREGTTASDGSGRNSPFTRALLANIETPGLEIDLLFRNIRDDVMAATSRGQQPIVYASLSKEKIFLKPIESNTLAPGGVSASLPKPQESGSKRYEERFGGSAAQTSSVSRAILYDEDPTDPKGRAYFGSVVWQTETVSNGGKSDLGLRAEIEIPERKLWMTLSIKPEGSQAASHIAELKFSLPPDFVGGHVVSVPGIIMKSNETARGTPLVGATVKVKDDVFLYGLSSDDRVRNLQMLKVQTWFDVPLVYANQRRAILAIEKGSSGERAYAQALSAWGQ